MFDDPKAYGLPHEEWRPHQFEVLEEIESLEDGQVLLVRAATGSGKSAWPAAVGHSKSAMVLSKTKLLQKQGYHDRYGFHYLFGRGSYPCALRKSTDASLCTYSENPKACPVYDKCEYYSQKARVMKAKKKALNYAYFQGAQWPRALAPYGVLFLDEAHLLSDLVIEYASVSVDAEQARTWGLPAFPRLRSSMATSMFNGTESRAIGWLERALPIMAGHVETLEQKAVDNVRARRDLRKATKLKWQVYGALKFLTESSDDWFISSGPSVFKSDSYGQPRQPGIIVKPLTARYHFSSQFILGGPTVLMTATTGDPDTFMHKELGMKDCAFIDVPSQYPPEQRPIYYMPDAPRISGKGTTSADLDHQADLVCRIVQECPSNWSGVIHTTSKRAAFALAGRLSMRGLHERVWVTPRNVSTADLLVKWDNVKSHTRGPLAVTWAWWVGVDLLDERINIITKVPFPFIGSDYTRARMDYDRDSYMQRTTRRFFQGCGRTRRGRPIDYDLPDRRRGVVAVLDAAWTAIKPYMSRDQLEQMTPWPS